MQRICKGCRHWDFFDMGFGNCRMAEWEEKDSLVLARNSEDHTPAELWTRVDFGCNQWDEATEPS